MKNDSSECKSYRANLAEKNEENNLYHTIGFTSINELRILNSCIYTNINKSKQNLYIKLIFVIHNLSNNNSMENYNNKIRLVINYNLHDDRKALNNWNNPDFFPIAFPILFFYRDSGHITLQVTKVSLHV